MDDRVSQAPSPARKPIAPLHGTASKPRRARRMAAAQAAAFIRALAAANPAPEPELEYQDPFTLLVAVVLSAQTTDLAVNKATATLFALRALATDPREVNDILTFLRLLPATGQALTKGLQRYSTAEQVILHQLGPQHGGGGDSQA